MEPTSTQKKGKENEKQEQNTALDTEFQTKHPLQYSWSWWYDNPQKKGSQQQTKASDWQAQLKKIYTFDTVEDFWCLWNNIKAANELSIGSNYHVFKDEILPMWEDNTNKQGGKWIVQVKNTRSNTDLNQLWMWGVLACIGNSFEDEEEVCGIVMSRRKGADKISLWTKTAIEEQKNKTHWTTIEGIFGNTGHCHRISTSWSRLQLETKV